MRVTCVQRPEKALSCRAIARSGFTAWGGAGLPSAAPGDPGGGWAKPMAVAAMARASAVARGATLLRALPPSGPAAPPACAGPLGRSADRPVRELVGGIMA